MKETGDLFPPEMPTELIQALNDFLSFSKVTKHQGHSSNILTQGGLVSSLASCQQS